MALFALRGIGHNSPSRLSYLPCFADPIGPELAWRTVMVCPKHCGKILTRREAAVQSDGRHGLIGVRLQHLCRGLDPNLVEILDGCAGPASFMPAVPDQRVLCPHNAQTHWSS